MKIKLDENISRHLKLVVNQKGHEAITVEDEGLLGKTDVEVGAVAKSEDRMLFTLDVEFSNLRKFPPGSHPGIVLFRPQSMGPLSVNRFITQFLEKADLASLYGCVVIVDPTRIRIRSPRTDADS
jgi:predicted nuclease of predicted toxin-antitoxin system